MEQIEICTDDVGLRSFRGTLHGRLELVIPIELVLYQAPDCILI